MLSRFVVTAETIVSKIFPAGAGWQAASLVAAGADPVTFALATGAGDGLGVLMGHTTYETLKGGQGRPPPGTLGTGALLGSAAFCSGTAWQPTVDLLSDTPLVVVGTGAVCAGVFLVGLRAGRRVYPVPRDVPLAKDAQLAASIGGACGAFVCTDPTLPLNPLADAVGIAPDEAGVLKAGASTSIGFATLQSAQNLTVRSAWMEP